MEHLLLDSGHLGEIEKMSNTTAISGVTTNPSLIAKGMNDGASRGCGANYYEYLRIIVEILGRSTPALEMVQRRHLSVEVLATSPYDIELEAIQLWAAVKTFPTERSECIVLHIKVPTTLDTLPVITRLVQRGIRVNATACATAAQAKMARDAGAAVVSFFYRRMKDAAGETEPGIEIAAFRKLRQSAGIICGSIREPKDVFNCWRYGADYVTAPMKVIEAMMIHPVTDAALLQFAEDARKITR